MKKIMIACFILTIAVGCGSSDSKKDSSTKTTDNSANPDYQKGLDLVAKSDCFTCHKIDETFTGPSYKEVVKRYADRPDTIIPHLARQIINGSHGEWGEIFMTPHPNVSQEDAETMVKYILLLK